MYLGSSQHTTHNSHGSCHLWYGVCNYYNLKNTVLEIHGIDVIICIFRRKRYKYLLSRPWFINYQFLSFRLKNTQVRGRGDALINQDFKKVSTKIDFLHGLAPLHIITVTQTSDITFCWAACWSKNFTVCHYLFGLGLGCWLWVGLGWLNHSNQ